LAGLATPLLVLSALVLLADLATAATSFHAADANRQAVAEGRDPSSVLTAYDGLALLAFALLVPTWIVGSLWLARARSNAERIAPQEMRRSPAWAFLGWVVPIVSLWFPKQIVDDSARVAQRATGTRHRLDTGWWWMAWIVYLLLGNVAGRIAFRDDGNSGGVYPGLDVAIAVTSALAFVAWVRVVRRLTALHERLLARGDGPPGDWGYRPASSA
jgi:hypothetical protein